jgi:hypothetical protein
MKKLLLLLLLLLITVNLKPETKYFVAKYFNIKLTGKEWVGWKPSNIYVTVDNFTRHININSNTLQSIDYSTLKYTLFIGYSLYTGDGTDNNGRTVGVTFQHFKNDKLYLTLEYSDVQYSYSLIETDPN